ncbi:MAG: GntR family transcriptional regulator, partial [Enterococcus sp.]|nr:GntR family transcriptional regulator [Enterococcus sp.]
MENSLQSQAYQSIRKKIIYSDLEPGKKISEKGLEGMFNIGRTPIRESLIQLRQQELVYTIPQSGTYVSQIDL